MILVAQKPSIQLEGFPITTEIHDIVYNDLLISNSKYIDIDRENHCITIKKSFFKKNKQVQNVTRFFAKLTDDRLLVEHAQTKRDPSFTFYDDVIDENFKNKTICIILESPHIDEYSSDGKKLIPKGPAQGLIGRKIERNIEQLLLQLHELNVLEENHRYRIIIMNAVNFQTSLHFIHERTMNNYYRDLRDKVWVKMWTEMPQVKAEFLNQLDLLKKDSILINACPKSLKPFIHQEFVNLSNKFILFESNHPSSTDNWSQSLFKLN